MELEFDVKIDTKALYDYMLHHSFNHMAGLLAPVLAVLLFIVGYQYGSPLYFILGAVLLVYQPWSLYLKAKRQALLPVFREPLHYKMTEEGLTVSQGETEQFQAWDDMVKATSTGRSLILYTGRVNAAIFPKSDLKELAPDVIRLISTHMPPSRVKIRG